jgi:hypothetical protein
MGKLSDIGWKRLGVLIDEHGEDGALHMICDSVACGMSLYEVCKNEGMPYSVLWRWLKGDGERMVAYRDALAARADMEAHRMLEIADGASVEDVAVGKLRVDTRKWLSERWGKGMYGKEEGGSGAVSFNIVIGSTHPELDEKYAAGELIEGKAVEVSDVLAPVETVTGQVTGEANG